MRALGAGPIRIMLRTILPNVVGPVLVQFSLAAASAVVLFRVTGRDPHASAELGFVVLSVVYGLFFATLAGFVAALLGKRFEMEHALAVASLIAALGAASLLGSVKSGAIWTQLAVILIIAPSAMLGGYLRQRQVRRA